MKIALFIRNSFCDIFYKIQIVIPKKHKTSLDASRTKARLNLITAGQIIPFPGSNMSAKVLKPPLSDFKISLLEEEALNKK